MKIALYLHVAQMIIEGLNLAGFLHPNREELTEAKLLSNCMWSGPEDFSQQEAGTLANFLSFWPPDDHISDRGFL